MMNVLLLFWIAALPAQHEHPVMGFDLAKTRHHFFLADTGGRIEVTARPGSDPDTVAQIRMHLQHIAHEFAEGRFDAPFATHGEVPPGVPAMQARKSAIAYRYEEMSTGARVVIATADGDALAAVHEFLRYQIREHKTGDPTKPESLKSEVGSLGCPPRLGRLQTSDFRLARSQRARRACVSITSAFAIRGLEL